MIKNYSSENCIIGAYLKIGVFGIKFLKIRAPVIKLEFVKENEKRNLGNWTARPWTCEGWIHNNDSDKVLKFELIIIIVKRFRKSELMIIIIIIIFWKCELIIMIIMRFW